MAHHKSAKKRIRRNERFSAVNGNRRSRIRTQIKKVEAAIAGGDKATAEVALKAAEPEMWRGAAKGVFHKNIMARKMSRLTARLNAMGA